ncbi:MAG: hypothetical protein JW914_07695 [Syntrophaceae bacterium]|nr:hypothetical protein [Syntrophaceae bacterium]
MNNYSYKQIKKEVITGILGSSILDRFRPKSTYRFNYAYYKRIKDEAKKNIVKQVLLDILNSDNLKRENLKYRTAYVASDIGLVEAKPIVEKLLMDNSLHGPCLLLIERAQEKFNISHNLSYDQVKEIMITLIGKKHVSAYFQGEFPYDFKDYYYSDLTNIEKKELIKRALMEILTDISVYTDRHRCYAAYFASIIGLADAKPIAEKMESKESIIKDKDSLYTLKQALNNFKDF